ncbi:thiamine phosphate synthase [Paenibacillus sp. JX-17]|uniref:Thiamine-phosphate synthase n=1 Tax=Paenibacillus lacisoli TaxID=3064525 RepID=A0ABT9CB31_9BACL|nr:thiamine phosphate synthase [Paenibacillus sp. JX-17]MDO7906467.1 thiamine phosphate synthase [Paenibacillus sp. JX-17]
MRRYLRLYLVAGSPNCLIHPDLILQEAIRGGVTLFQFREKGPGALTGMPLIELAQRLQKVCRSQGVPFIVNDDVELALTVDADGVHVGQEDLAAHDVRTRIGSKILGVSAHSVEEARLAISDGADYLGIGPVYPTESKPDARAVQGPGLIRRLRESGIDAPLVGIGGLTAANAGTVMSAGADGIAVISAITAAASPQAASAELWKAVNRNGE